MPVKEWLESIQITAYDVANCLADILIGVIASILLYMLRTLWKNKNEESWKKTRELVNKTYLLLYLGIRYEDLPRGDDLRLRIRDAEWINIANRRLETIERDRNLVFAY